MEAARSCTRAPRRLVALCSAALALLVGCDRDHSSSPCPTYQVGALEGRVLAGGEPVATWVTLRGPENPGRELESSKHTARTDTTGFYHLDLPTGTYRFEWPGERFCGLGLDTVVIEPRVQRLNLLSGRVNVSIPLPGGFDGRSIAVTLQSVARDQCRKWGSMEVRDGHAEGSFDFVPPGTYRLGTGGSSNWTVWFPGTLDFESGDSLTVGIDHPARYTGSISTPAVFSGRIEGAWRLVPQLRSTYVTLLAPDSTGLEARSVEEDGSFAFLLFMPPPFRVRIESEGIVRWVGGDSYETATAFELKPGDRVEDVALVDSGIACRLEGPGSIVEYDAQLLVRDEHGRSYLSDPQDRNPLTLCNLPPGRYYVQARGFCLDQVWAPRWFGDTESLAAAVPIDLDPGGLAQITIRLVSGGRIQGRVLDPLGGPDEWASVTIHDARGEPLCAGSQGSSQDGSFDFGGLADGDYYLEVYTECDVRWWYPGTCSIRSATPIRVRDHGTVSGIEWAEGGR